MSTNTRSTRALSFFLAASSLALSSCIFAIEDSKHHEPEQEGLMLSSVSSEEGEGAALPAGANGTSAQDPGATKEKAGEKPKSAKKEDPARKAMLKERKLNYARTDLRIAQLSTAAEAQEAEADVARAKRELEEKRRALEHYKSVEIPLRLEEEKIDYDRVDYRADEAKDELQELESTYKKEEFAEITKELVVKRSRRQLELAQRGLAVEKKKMADLKEQELPKKQRELEDELRKAEESLRKAEVKLQKTVLENEMAIAKAQDKINDLEHDEGDEEGGEGEAKP